MARILIVSEKPSSAQKIASALGNAQRKARKKVSYYEIERGGDLITVVPAVGHLYSLQQSSGGSNYPVFDVEWTPTYLVSKTSGYTRAYLELITDLAKDADNVVAATDYDVEGEVIAANIVEFACKKDDARRMKFSTMTAEELSNAYDNALPTLNHGMADAGRTRHTLDFFWGISLSRALMHAIKSAGMFRVMSIGRVQGPALAVLSRKEKEIAAFVPTPYWVVLATIKQAKFEHDGNPFKLEPDADAALAKAGKKGVAEKVERKEYLQPPPAPFDLTTLQTEAYRCFGLTPTQTLEIAQYLYEQGLCSYPRTASQKLPEQLGLPNIIRKLGTQEAYAKPAGQLVKEKRFTPAEGKQTDPAHPAIYPTGEKPGKANPLQLKVYDLVVKRFLACFAPPAKRERVSVNVRLGTEPFSASGTRTIERNWIDYYEPYAELEEETLPDFKEGAAVEAESVWKENKETQPPKRYTQASLVRKLEEDGIGTKATRAGIIQTLFDRGYVKDKSIAVTPFGMAVYGALSKNSPQILDENLTREFEQDMEAIQEGRKKSKDILERGKKTLSSIVDDFRKREPDIGRELLEAFKTTQRSDSVVGKCSCGNNLVMRKSKYGIFVGCSGYPNCRITYPLPKGALIKPTGKACPKCGTPQVTVRRRGKKPWTMCLLPTCETRNWSPQPATATPAAPTAPSAPATHNPAETGKQ